MAEAAPRPRDPDRPPRPIEEDRPKALRDPDRLQAPVRVEAKECRRLTADNGMVSRLRAAASVGVLGLVVGEVTTSLVAVAVLPWVNRAKSSRLALERRRASRKASKRAAMSIWPGSGSFLPKSAVREAKEEGLMVPTPEGREVVAVAVVRPSLEVVVPSREDVVVVVPAPKLKSPLAMPPNRLVLVVVGLSV